MTIIAWDGTTLAADKRASSDRGFTSTTTKIFAMRDSLVGVGGPLCTAMLMLAWYEAGAVPEDFPELQCEDETRCVFMVVDRNGRSFSYENTPYPIINSGKYHVEGCGSAVAATAMHLGFDARRAVEIACELNSGCGNGIDTLTLADLKKGKGKKK